MWTFDNRSLRALPADPEPRNFRRQVPGACYSRVQPEPVADPQLAAFAPQVAELVGLSATDMANPAVVAALGGNQLMPGMDPYANRYGGHQFGNWAGQLGDGRAISLGEAVHDGRFWEIQLKGAGPTPYSRQGDGRAVLRSSLREFLCSEAMHHLGVPTTRALSLVLTGDRVVRDMFYDGHPEAEPGAIACRVAPSFLRFGSFQIHAALGEHEVLQQLVDTTLSHHFADLGPPGRETTLAWLAHVAKQTARLVIEWMRVGFVHGVMNTDNMSIHGLTIDYGPYGWLEGFDAGWTPNTTDAHGRRYCFGRQPEIAHWNLIRFAEALHPIVGDVSDLETALNTFVHTWEQEHPRMMAAKLGLSNVLPGDDDLISGLYDALHGTETDMTIFFRRLGELQTTSGAPAPLEVVADAFYDTEAIRNGDAAAMDSWLGRYLKRLAAEERPDEIRRVAMHRVNPKYVLRNYLAQLAIDQSTQGDHSLLQTFLDLLETPYDEHPEHVAYAAKRPEWARDRPGCSMLSCSS